MSKKTLVTISNVFQFKRFISKIDRSAINDCAVVCDNARLHSFLKKQNVAFDALDEFCIKDRWREINSWGCDRAGELIRVGREGRFFKDVDLASVAFHHFPYLLIHMVKNYLYAQHLVAKYNPSRVMVFEFPHERQFPDFSGNFYLNQFLSTVCSRSNILIEPVDITVDSCKNEASLSSKLPAKEMVRRLIQKLYGAIVRPGKDIEMLAVGSLRHLAATVNEIKNKGHKIAIYDFEFHREIFDFAVRHGLQYLLPESFQNIREDYSSPVANRFFSEFKKLIETVSSMGSFKFDSFDFGPTLLQYVYQGMPEYFKRLSKQTVQYQNIVAHCQLLAVLSDEDITERGALRAAYLNSRGVKQFCVSHANLVHDFSVAKENRVFAQSITFAASEFEKSMYEARGWDGKQIIVTGVPRYDHLVKMCQAKSARSRNVSQFKLLYCGATMSTHWPDKGGYLGIHVVNLKDIQQKTLRAILDAIDGLPVELVVKPHYDEGTAWHDFFKNEKPANKITIEKHSASFFELLMNCDAMTLAHTSTPIMEAAICSLPTILVDLFRPAELVSYEDIGIQNVARSVPQIKQEVLRLIDDKSRRLRPNPDPKLEFYLGKLDGMNNVRVVECIQQLLNEPPPPSVRPRIQNQIFQS